MHASPFMNFLSRSSNVPSVLETCIIILKIGLSVMLYRVACSLYKVACVPYKYKSIFQDGSAKSHKR